MLKVYISYGTVQDQVTALRLQALAAVNGLSAYVPPAHTRKPGGVLDEQSKEKLRDSGGVLGTVGGDHPSAAWRQECDIANQTSKLRIHIAPDDQLGLLDNGVAAVGLDATQPRAEAVTRLSEFLSKLEIPTEKKKTLMDLSLVALGLVGLQPQV
jgi:hypothetical protein